MPREKKKTQHVEIEKPAQQKKGRGRQQDSDDDSEASEVPQMVKGGREAQKGQPQKKASKAEPEPASEEDEEVEESEEEEEVPPKPKKQQQKGKQKAKEESEEDEPTPKAKKGGQQQPTKKERKRQQDSDSEDEAPQRGGNKKEQKKDHNQQDADSESGDKAPIQQGGVNADANGGDAGECSEDDYFNKHLYYAARRPPRRLRAVAICENCRELSKVHCNFADVRKGTDIPISYSSQCSECKKDVKGDGVIEVKLLNDGCCFFWKSTLSGVTPSLVEHREPIADASPVRGSGQSVVVNGTDSDGESWLIDTGYKKDVDNIVKAVKYEDCLYISVSHRDQDHAAGAIKIKKELSSVNVHDLMFFHSADGRTETAKALAGLTGSQYLIERASPNVTLRDKGNISGLRHRVLIPNMQRLRAGWDTIDSEKCNKASLCNILTASSRSQQPDIQIAITGDQTYSFFRDNLPEGLRSFDLLWLPHHASIASLDAALHPADFYVVHAQNGKDQDNIKNSRVNAFEAVKELSGSVTEEKKQHRSCVTTLVYVCKNFDYVDFEASVNIENKTMRVVIVSDTPKFILRNSEYDTHVCLKVPRFSLVYERSGKKAEWYVTEHGTHYYHNSPL